MKSPLIIFILVFVLLIFLSCEGPQDEPEITYSVNFQANGGNPEPAKQNVKFGGKVTQPDAMTKEGCFFDGWYKDNSYTNEWNFYNNTVTENITLYARWVVAPHIVQGVNFIEKLGWIASNAQNNGYYIIEISNDITIDPVKLYYSNKIIFVEIRSIETTRTINLRNNVLLSMFEIQSGVTLILSNIELKGTTDKNVRNSLIDIKSGGSFILDQGAKIYGHGGTTYLFGGGVYVSEKGYFYMYGGEISGNIAHSGGAVYIKGVFVMYDGVIYGNGSGSGGGVYVGEKSHFFMNGGEIKGNTSESYTGGGGGVYVGEKSYFYMDGGEIKGNTSGSYIDGGGGGVYIYNSVFNKTGGTIYGYTDGDSNSNAAKIDRGTDKGTLKQQAGHAICIGSYNSIFKDTTSGQDNNLYFNGTINPPAFSGTWDYKE